MVFGWGVHVAHARVVEGVVVVVEDNRARNPGHHLRIASLDPRAELVDEAAIVSSEADAA